MKARQFRLRTVLSVMIALCVSLAMTRVLMQLYVREARINTVRSRLAAFEQQISIYALDLEEVPSTKQGLGALRVPPADLPDPTKWNGPYAVHDLPADPWGQRYGYERLGADQFHVFSSGPDGMSGTKDDISIYSSVKYWLELRGNDDEESAR